MCSIINPILHGQVATLSDACILKPFFTFIINPGFKEHNHYVINLNDDFFGQFRYERVMPGNLGSILKTLFNSIDFIFRHIIWADFPPQRKVYFEFINECLHIKSVDPWLGSISNSACYFN